MASDGLIISYPKSGRTWLRYAFELAGVTLEITHKGAGTAGHRVGGHYSRLRFNPHHYDACKVVFLHRHPIDTAVSNFHQMRKREVPKWSLWRTVSVRCRGGYPPGDITEFVLSPRYGVDKICRFNLGWIAQFEPRAEAMIASYERLSANPVSEFERLLSFIRPDLVGKVDITEIMRRCSFDEMREMERQGRGITRGYESISLDDPNAFKARRGKVGGYREELAPEAIRLAEERIDQLSYNDKIKRYL